LENKEITRLLGLPLDLQPAIATTKAVRKINKRNWEMVNEAETLDDIVEAANLFFLSPLLNLCALCRQKKYAKKLFRKKS
jgi:hypothetical protein